MNKLELGIIGFTTLEKFIKNHKDKKEVARVKDAVTIFNKITNTDVKDIYLRNGFGYPEIIYFNGEMFYMVNPELSSKSYDEYLNYLEKGKSDENKKVDNIKSEQGKRSIAALLDSSERPLPILVIEEFETMKNEFEKLLEGKDFKQHIFKNINKPLLPFLYTYYYKYMNVEKRFDVFIDFYKKVDNMAQCIPNEILIEALNNVPKKIKDKIAKLKRYDEDGYLTVYRGAESKSTAPNDAISWTTKKSVAKFFSDRFKTVGEVFVGRVHKENIVYIYRDEEAEVLVLPGKVEDIRLI